MKRRIVRTAEVTIETEEKTALRGSQGQRPTLMWCPACRRQVEMVTPEQAAQIAGVSARTIYRWIEAGSIHFMEGSGHLWVCLPPLSTTDQDKRPHVSNTAKDGAPGKSRRCT